MQKSKIYYNEKNSKKNVSQRFETSCFLLKHLSGNDYLIDKIINSGQGIALLRNSPEDLTCYLVEIYFC